MAGLAVFGVCAVAVVAAGVRGWELDVTRWVNGLPAIPSWLYRPGVMTLGTIVGVAVVALWAGLWWRTATVSVQILVAGAVAYAMETIAKPLFGRGRPPEYLAGIDLRIPLPGNEGFPSGHATVVFAVAAVVASWMPGRRAVIPYAIAGVVAVGRVYVGVHFPLDVVGGAGLGLACGLGTVLAWRFVSGGERGRRNHGTG